MKGIGARLLFIAAGSLILVGVLTASALGSDPLGQPVHIGINPLKVGFKGWTSPAKLSQEEQTPVTLHLEGSISTTDGSRIPALETLSLYFDRAGSIFTKGLPTCSLAELEGEIEWVKPPCQNALIGHGKVTAQPYFPEGVDLHIAGPLEIFNGRPKNGHPVLIYRVRAHVPAYTTFLTSGEVLNQRGKFGTQISIHIPKIINGVGSLTSFKAIIGKSWTYKGKKVSLLSASCPKGSLAGEAEFDFVGGEKFLGEIVKPCAGFPQ